MKKKDQSHKKPPKKEDITEDDFIIINGVKYVRASSDQSTGQNNFSRAKRKMI